MVRMSGGAVPGLALGVLIAFGFAFVIRVLPEELFTETGPSAAFYALQVAAGPVFVIVLRRIARALRIDPQALLLWAVAGALAFDGLVIGFWPSLYGQTGEALTYAATTLLWAFAWILIASLVMNGAPTTTGADEEGASAP